MADREVHWRSFAHRVVHLDHSDVACDQVDWNFDYSRRARGFATYAAIASLGRTGIGRIDAAPQPLPQAARCPPLGSSGNARGSLIGPRETKASLLTSTDLKTD